MLGFRREKDSQDAKPESVPGTAPVASSAPPRDAGVSSAGTSVSSASRAGGSEQEPDHKATKRLGEMLVENGSIRVEQLEEALGVQREQGGFLGQILVDLKYVQQDEIMTCLVRQCKIPHLSLADYEISKDVLQLIPKEICLAHNVIPIDKLGRILTIAMANPLDTDAIEEVQRACPELRIKPILCDWQHFRQVAARVFGIPQESKVSDFAKFDPGVKGKAAEQPAEMAPPEQPAAPAAPAAPVAQSALDEIVRKTIQDAAEFDTDSPPESPPPRAKAVPVDSPGMTTQQLSTLVREDIASAMQQAMSVLMIQTRANEVRQEQTMAPRELADLVREGVTGAMEESLGELSLQLRTLSGKATASMPGPSDPPSAAVFAEVVRESVGTAMEQTLKALAPQLQSGPPAASNGMSSEQLADAVREGVSRALEGSRKEALAPVAAAGRPERAGLVRETLRETEALAVARANRQDLEARDAERLKRARHASSVAAINPIRSGKELPDSPEWYAERDERVLAAMNSDRLLRGYSFDNFLAGYANAFTFELCRAVAEEPGGHYNPFFLCGDVGLGKTHLINAIGNAVMAEDPNKRIGYISSSRFASRLGEAVRDGAVSIFRENYCHWEVLILDDIQFLGGRVEAQEEFFHIFNVLQQEDRQIIIASDKAPDRLGLLEQRLVSRFAGGIVASLKPPEWETRVGILKRHLRPDQKGISDEVLSLIAMRVTNDNRKMIGALRKIAAFGELGTEPLTYELANEILSHLGIEEAA